MKSWTLISLLSLLLLTQSCDECRNIDCIPPAPEFSFQLVDADTGEDLALNGAVYDPDSIKITSPDPTSDKEYPLEYNQSGNKLIFTDLSIGFENPGYKSNYLLVLNSSTSLPFSLKTSVNDGGCCTSYSIEEIASSEATISAPANQIFYYLIEL